MKRSSGHYPNTGIQHTRCMIALRCTMAFLDMFHSDSQTSLDLHLAGIRENVQELVPQTKAKRYISSNAYAAIDLAFEVVGPHVDKTENDAENFRRWCDLVGCAAIFLLDVLATCPGFVSGKYARYWRELKLDVEELAAGLTGVYGHAITDKDGETLLLGEELYHRAAYAMDGIAFISHEQLERECPQAA